MVTYIPRCTRYYCSGTCLEHNLVKDSRVKGKYAAVGIGTLLIESTPILYEGINEKGLMGGQLNYRCFANYKNKRAQGIMPVQPSFAVTYLLTQCSTVKEVIDAVKNKITLVSIPLLGIIPMIHWIFADKAGDNVIIEPDKNGLSIYYNSMGVMTHSPSVDIGKNTGGEGVFLACF